MGILNDNKIEEVPFGRFIVEKPENEEVKKQTTFTGYDYMIKFNVAYKDENQYPISLKNYLINLCNQIGVELGSTKLVNENYQILGNPFTNNENCKTVLSAIAQLCGGFAKIGRDNKLYIVNINSNEYVKGLTVNEVHHINVVELNELMVKQLNLTQGVPTSEVIDGNSYISFNKNNQYGEVNSVVLRLSQIEGENDTMEDEKSININGLTEVVIEDNPFLINSDERKKVIGELWKTLKGLKYLPFKMSEYYGFPYLDTGDKIEILDTDDNQYISFVFNHSFTYNGTFKGSLETQAPTKTQTAYKNTNTIKTKFKNVERSIDKINGVIEDVIEEQNETSDKLSKHEQTIDGFKDTAKKVDENSKKLSEHEQTIDGFKDIVSDERKATTSELMTLLNNGYLTADQVNALVNGNTEDIGKIKEQIIETKTSSGKIIEAIKEIEVNGVKYLKNMLFTLNDEGLFIATSQDEFNAKYNNKGMFLYSYDQMIAKYDKDGAYIKDLEITGELRTGNLRIMDVVVNGENRTHIHWIGG